MDMYDGRVIDVDGDADPLGYKNALELRARNRRLLEQSQGNGYAFGTPFGPLTDPNTDAFLEALDATGTRKVGSGFGFADKDLARNPGWLEASDPDPVRTSAGVGGVSPSLRSLIGSDAGGGAAPSLGDIAPRNHQGPTTVFNSGKRLFSF